MACCSLAVGAQDHARRIWLLCAPVWFGGPSSDPGLRLCYHMMLAAVGVGVDLLAGYRHSGRPVWSCSSLLGLTSCSSRGAADDAEPPRKARQGMRGAS